MKTPAQISKANARLQERLLTPGLSDNQLLLITGMANAIVWVLDGVHSTSMQRLLSDEPLAAGKDPGPALRGLTAGLQAIKNAPKLVAVVEDHQRSAVAANFTACGCDWCNAWRETMAAEK